jgi:hypothetical protein
MELDIYAFPRPGCKRDLLRLYVTKKKHLDYIIRCFPYPQKQKISFKKVKSAYIVYASRFTSRKNTRGWKLSLETYKIKGHGDSVRPINWFTDNLP